MSNKPAVNTSVRTPNTGAQGTLFNNLWGDTSNVVGTAVNQPIAQSTGATMAENAYRTGLGLTGEIPALAQSATSQALTPAATTEAAGGLQQGFAQGGLQDIINRYFLQGQGPLGFLGSAANIGGA